MRAFISYSLNNSEEYIITILSRVLNTKGYIISSSYYSHQHGVGSNQLQLTKSNLFIGIVTVKGNENERVIADWRQANKNKIPALLLVENRVKLSESLKRNANVLTFNRLNPELAINVIKNKITSASQKQQILKETANDNTAAWIFGGLAALALIGLLSEDK